MRMTYEVHTLVKGRWNIEGTYRGNQREEALEDAKRLNRESFITGVKVICETYNEQTNQSSEVVIFDTTKPAREPARKPPPKPAAEAEKTEDMPLVRHQQKAPAKRSPLVTATLVLALLAALAVFLLLATYGEEIMRAL